MALIHFMFTSLQLASYGTALLVLLHRVSFEHRSSVVSMHVTSQQPTRAPDLDLGPRKRQRLILNAGNNYSSCMVRRRPEGAFHLTIDNKPEDYYIISSLWHDAET